MSPLEIAVVRRKLARIVEDLGRLRRATGLDLEAWRADEDRRDALERRLQTCVDAAIDLNAHLLVALGHPAPASSYQGFLELAARTGVLDESLAARLAPSAGLRNRLVHRYDDLDDALVLQGVHRAVELFPRYVAAVQAYLDDVRPA